MTQIRAQDLCRTLGGREVLREVTFRVEEGERVALVGPSGAGKTSLLRTLVGLDPFDGGTLEVAGVRVSAGARPQDSARAALRRTSGIVFQQWHLFPHRTALENVMEAPVHVAKLSPRLARSEAHAWLERVGLGDRAGAHPAELSGGEQQRCAIARALAMRPKVLYLDEPTSALDKESAQSLGALLRELHGARDLTLVTVTHDAAFAAAVADRTLRLAGGCITAQT